MAAINTVSGLMMCISETPADFIANSSNRSPRLPNVISDANKMARGNAIGIRNNAAYKNISPKTGNPNPLPTMSSIYLQMNCISTMKRHMPKVIRNNGRNVCNMNVYKRFILRIFYRIGGAKVLQKMIGTI